jgi:VWFA-related protein
MNSLLVALFLAVPLIAVVLTITRVRKHRTDSAARVSALQALVAEETRKRPVQASTTTVVAPAPQAPSLRPAAAADPLSAGVVAVVYLFDRHGTCFGTVRGEVEPPPAHPPAMRPKAGTVVATAMAAFILATAGLGAQDPQQKPSAPGFSFRTGVELINVTATVTDVQGRFVSGLKAEDFEVYEDGKRQTITQFDSERVPVSLGIALDTSGSMNGDKWPAAQSAVNRFLYDLLGEQDEAFLYRFDSQPRLLGGWTEDRRGLGRTLASVTPGGGTAMYDAVAAAIPMAQSGSRRKKALVVISDGNDTNSRTDMSELRQLIRESEVLIYAIGIDASGGSASAHGSSPAQSSASSGAQRSRPVPSAFPGARTPSQPSSLPPAPAPSTSSSSSTPRRSSPTDRLNADALRFITDDSGGRTEIIMSARDLEPATAGVASELNRQYFLGYSTSLPKDGRWHTLEVRVKGGGKYTIRARKGFIAD